MQPTLALLLLVCGRYASGQLHHERTNEAGPYHVSLRTNDDQYCGGTIVDDRWILTAAQCYGQYSKENSTVLAGMNNLKTNGTSYLIDRFIVHSRFNKKQISIAHNIALIRLASPLVYNKFVEKIEISYKFVPDYAILTSVGTNRTNPSTKIVKVLPSEECMWKYQNTKLGPFINAGILCTVNPVDGSPVSGTTGSGLTREGKLVGVFAGTYGPSLFRFRNANTRVSYYHDWILTTIANNREEKAVPYGPSVRN